MRCGQLQPPSRKARAPHFASLKSRWLRPNAGLRPRGSRDPAHGAIALQLLDHGRRRRFIEPVGPGNAGAVQLRQADSEAVRIHAAAHDPTLPI